MTPELTSARQKRILHRKPVRRSPSKKQDLLESETAVLQHQVGNREVQRLLSSRGKDSKANADLVFRKPTKPTLITLPVMDRIEDAYGSGSLDPTQWRDLLTAARQAYQNRDVKAANAAYLRLFADVAVLAQAGQVVNFSGNVGDINVVTGATSPQNVKPGLNFWLASSATLDAGASTAYVDSQGNWAVNAPANGPRPAVAILFSRDAFKPEKEATLGTMRHEMTHAEHRTFGAIAVSDPRVKSGYVDHSAANTEVLGYVEGFMTMYHLSDPASLNDNHPAFHQLLGVLQTDKLYPWVSAKDTVRAEALGRLQEYYFNALDQTHRMVFDAWVEDRLRSARGEDYTKTLSSPGVITQHPPGAVDFFSSLRRIIANKRGVPGLSTPMKL